MGQPAILFSIVIPTYNYAKTLRRAVASVSRQLSSAHELLVIDDGSTDETPEVIIQLKIEYGAQARFIRKENGGPSSTRNLGIQETTGDFLIFLDADDELLPDALALLTSHIAQHPDTRMIIGGHTSITPDGKMRRHLPKALPGKAIDRLREYLLEKEIALSNGACAMHRALFDRATYPENFRNAEDIPVFAQALAGYPCTTLNEPLALIHKHEDSLRHQFNHARATGLKLVDEIFSPIRMGVEFQALKPEFYLQRCLSLFRSAYLAGDDATAKEYFSLALKMDWRVLFHGSYSRKAIRLWLGSLFGKSARKK